MEHYSIMAFLPYLESNQSLRSVEIQSANSVVNTMQILPSIAKNPNIVDLIISSTLPAPKK
jgi:hypothetical protein